MNSRKYSSSVSSLTKILFQFRPFLRRRGIRRVLLRYRRDAGVRLLHHLYTVRPLYAEAMHPPLPLRLQRPTMDENTRMYLLILLAKSRRALIYLGIGAPGCHIGNLELVFRHNLSVSAAGDTFR